MAPSLVLAKELYTFFIGYYNKSKECLKVVKVLQDPLPHLRLKMLRLELTIGRSYQTHSHNIHLKITGFARRFSRRRNLKEDTLLLLRQSNVGKKNCSFLLLESLRPLSPPQEPQVPLSSTGTPDFLSTFLGIDSFRSKFLSLFGA